MYNGQDNQSRPFPFCLGHKTWGGKKRKRAKIGKFETQNKNSLVYLTSLCWESCLKTTSPQKHVFKYFNKLFADEILQTMIIMLS